jgi:4-hydroxy-3-methylbut-2-enyl diphosphate reductase
MKIIRAASTGMCFGVRDALAIIESVERPEEVTIHGELVHNETVLLQLGARGFRMTSEADRSGLPDTSSVLITAHGISDRERSQVQRAGKRLIDTTCPLVTQVHRAARSLQRQGNFVLVVGRRGHVEVRGIVEDLADFAVVETVADVQTYPCDRIGVVCQTTTAPATVAAVRRTVAERNPQAQVRFVDTTCAPTRDRQRSLAQLLPRVDAVVVVGGRNSNNTLELAALCRSAGKPVFHVQTADGLRADWFEDCPTVGVAAGTSTLDETIDAVESRLREIGQANGT